MLLVDQRGLHTHMCWTTLSHLKWQQWVVKKLYMLESFFVHVKARLPLPFLLLGHLPLHNLLTVWDYHTVVREAIFKPDCTQCVLHTPGSAAIFTSI